MTARALGGSLGVALVSTLGCTPQAAVKDHDLAQINVQLGIEYMKEGSYETALDKLDKAVDLDPNDPSAHNVLGVVHDRLGETDKAEKNFERALSLGPKDPSVLNNYGQFLCRQGREEEGQQMFAKAIGNPLYTTPEVARTNAGICAVRKNDLNQAETHFRAALTLNPSLPAALLEMADLSYQMARYLPARGYFQRYLAVAQQTARSLWVGILIERKLGDLDAVASYSVALKNRYPDAEQTRQLLQSEE